MQFSTGTVDVTGSAFKSALYPLDRSQDVFNWEPL